KVQLARSPQDSANTTFTLDPTVATGHAHRIVAVDQVATPNVSTRTFDPKKDISGNVINYTYSLTDNKGNALATGDAVVYHNGGGASIGLAGGGSLVDGGTYYAIVTGPGSLELAATQSEATSGNPLQLAVDPNANYGAGQSILLPGEVPQPSGALTGQATVTANTTTFQGVAVTATNQDMIATAGVSGGGAGSVAVNVGGSVNVLTTDTEAYVAQGAQVNSSNAGANAAQSVLVAAANNYRQIGVAGAVSISGSASVAPGADVRVVKNTTLAYIDDATTVNAARDVLVTATASENILSIAAGIGGSGEVAVGGAVAVTVLNNQTQAYIGRNATSTAGGADVNAGGNVLVSASDDTTINAIAGSLGIGIGAVGAGASVGVISITKDTEASVGKFATVNAAANGPNSLLGIFDGGSNASGYTTLPGFMGLAVQAESSESILNLALSGAGGLYAGVAGGVSVELIGSTTKAFIGQGAVVDAASGASSSQSVNVSAANTVNVNAVGGGVGVGIAGIGGGVDVGVLQNNTSAYIDAGANVSALGNVAVNALSTKNVQTLALSAAGGIVGVVGSVSVWTIGSQFSSTYSDGTAGNERGAWASGVSYAQGDIVTGSDGNQYVARAANVSDPTTDPTLGTSASKADWGQVSSQSLNTSGGGTIQSFADGQAGGKMGSGGYTSILNGYQGDSNPNDSMSRVASSTSNSGSTLNSDAPVNPSQTATSGQAPPSGTSAFIGAGATVTSGAAVQVVAKDQVNFQVITGAAAVGAAAIGASVAVVTVNSNTNAQIAGGATITAGSGSNGNVLVNASLVETTNGLAFAGLAGALALGGQVVYMNDTSTQIAHVDPGAAIDQAGGTVTVEADATRADNPTAAGVSFGGVTAGAAIAIANIGGSTQAYMNGVFVGQAAGESVNNLQILADSHTRTQPTALGIAAGLSFSLNGAVAIATINPSIVASIGDNSQVQVTGNLGIESLSEADGHSDAFSVTLSLGAALGASIATSTVSPSLTSEIGTNSNVGAGGNLTVESL
ncbi:MAG: hypothetical protein KGM43_06095, partial [Planctomycetota bacterium]|nr:hypothetical protein [Planctomycetota bacterium]